MDLIAFEGPVWRLLATSLSDRPTIPAGAPEGRFHHAGQTAVYASLSAEGAGVAIRRYLSDGVPRVLVPLRLATLRAADVRGRPEASIVWQDIRAGGMPSPTWDFSDRARASGAEAMLYSSRSRPELGHVVIFEPACLVPSGPAVPFVP